jgi:hypothetical protein
MVVGGVGSSQQPHSGGSAFAECRNAQAKKHDTVARIIGAILAIALQGAFLLILVKSTQTNVPRRAAAEITLLLSPVHERPVAVSLPAMPGLPSLDIPYFPRLYAPEAPRMFAAPARMAPEAAPGFQGLGVSLFDCRPENYANLPADERAHCTPLGSPMAALGNSDLLGQRSHVEDNMRWANALAHEKSPPMLPCMGGLDVLCLLKNVAGLADGSTLDPQSSLRDPEQWGSYVDPQQFMPRNQDSTTASRNGGH